MPHHGNEEEHGDEPVNFNDKRKIDPETGQPRGTEDAEAESEDSAPADTGAEALAEAERIINEAGEEPEPALEATATDVEAELRNDLLRLQAEYVNYRKRVERDREQVRELAVQSVLNSLLPVLDDLDAARAHGDLEDGPFAAVARKLGTILEGHGLERIEEAGVEFDPNFHEALMQQPNAEVPSDHVAQVLRVGYKKGERVMRAAGVIVSTGE
ncbi:nucleotide exchange factor GrpE [Zhihengliuella salsuginis]|uniref:Protein GrpE n=1 Tax=Zhihengliuella salsuginis TaxID=578222 RepID=A0ABQ3GF52_9MICC|nr:nucleotide exchange factor GrpE [Zhihengliuella salsuginis]GHD02702.1 protein GrpE [Zhihengliuella salsuginis]